MYGIRKCFIKNRNILTEGRRGQSRTVEYVNKMLAECQVLI